MSRICAFCVLFIQIGFSLQFLVESGDDKTVNCVLDILLANYKPKTQLTVIAGEDDKILPAVNHMSYVSIKLLNSTAKIIDVPFDSGYLIVANDSADFIKKINRITAGISWNAKAKMLIVLKNDHDSRCIFDILLRKHVFNVVILNESTSLDLYTYNPFEDFGCGKRYNKIIKLGRCSGQSLFYDKLVTGLQNCTFRAFSAHIPPYSIDPAAKESEHQGIDQYILNLLAQKERFKINFTYNMDFDEFSIIADNLTAVGSLSALQNGAADIINGGMFLMHDRALAFVYLTGGFTFTDYLQLYVSTARQISNLKRIYMGFQWTIWLALFVVFVVYSVLMHLMMRKQPKQAIILKMFGFFLQQSSEVKGDKPKRIFIFWIFFAYLINCHYQSTLVSFTLEPHPDYQISSFDDILRHHLEPCVSLIMTRVARQTGFVFFSDNSNMDCEGREESLNIVANSNKHFTVYLYSLFAYHKTKYFDEYGNPKIYTISYPKAQMLYAIYLYKEFPLVEKLQQHCRRIEEAGLINEQLHLLSTEKMKKLSFISKRKIPYFLIPWHVLGFGVILSTFVLCLEIVIYKYK